MQSIDLAELTRLANEMFSGITSNEAKQKTLGVEPLVNHPLDPQSAAAGAPPPRPVPNGNQQTSVAPTLPDWGASSAEGLAWHQEVDALARGGGSAPRGSAPQPPTAQPTTAQLGGAPVPGVHGPGAPSTPAFGAASAPTGVLPFAAPGAPTSGIPGAPPSAFTAPSPPTSGIPGAPPFAPPSAPGFTAPPSAFTAPLPTVPTWPAHDAAPIQHAPNTAQAPSFYFLETARAPIRSLERLAVPVALDPRSVHSGLFAAPGAQPHGAAPHGSLSLASLRALRAPFDVQRVRSDFPILSERVNGRPLVWLDNAATTQKPRAVIERLAYFYEHENSNIHRAAHTLAARATDAYEDAREKVRAFLNASSTREIVFLRGATEAINLVARTFGRSRIGAGDEIIVSHLEHHANIVPWQLLAREVGAKLRVIPVDDDGQILLEEYGKLLGPRTKLVSITQVSNALGTVTPVKQVVDLAHSVGAHVLVDGAQAVSHTPVNVTALDADFYVFSGHKVFGPTGIGVLYGRAELLDELPPWQGGGNMIQDVTFEHTRYHAAPARFEAGTGNIADAVGLGAALDYVTRIGMPLIEAYEHELLAYGTRLLSLVPGLRVIGTAREKAGVLSFVLEGFRTDEVSRALSEDGIAVRGGHHCAQPILRRFGLESTVRPSLAFYNDCADLDALGEALLRLKSRRVGRVAVPAFPDATFDARHLP